MIRQPLEETNKKVVPLEENSHENSSAESCNEYKLSIAIEDPRYIAFSAVSAHGHKDHIQKIPGEALGIDSVASESATALCRAAGHGHTEVVQLLDDAGANIHK